MSESEVPDNRTADAKTNNLMQGRLRCNVSYPSWRQPNQPCANVAYQIREKARLRANSVQRRTSTAVRDPRLVHGWDERISQIPTRPGMSHAKDSKVTSMRVEFSDLPSKEAENQENAWCRRQEQE